MQQSPRIAVFTLGGTIAMTSKNGGAVTPALCGDELLAAVPGLDNVPVALDVKDFRRLPGASLQLSDIAELSQQIKNELAAGAAGAVVVQGTDSIEETAYLLDLLHDGAEPIVVTGAMRHPGLAGADGPANLLAAVRVAVATASRGRGCLVVLNDEIHAARWVRKTHTTSPSAFASPASGPLGFLVEGLPEYRAMPSRRACGSLELANLSSNIRLVTVSLGDQGNWLPAYAADLDGLVVSGFGAGHVPASWVEPLEQIASRVPVVLASRIGVGPVLRDTYGFAGSESDLRKRGLIGAGTLDPYKARLLLWTLVACGTSRNAIEDAFSEA